MGEKARGMGLVPEGLKLGSGRRQDGRLVRLTSHHTTPAWPRADAADKPDPTPPPQDVTYTIVVDFGEWNVKNGYTAPAVKPNRWPLRRSHEGRRRPSTGHLKNPARQWLLRHPWLGGRREGPQHGTRMAMDRCRTHHLPKVAGIALLPVVNLICLLARRRRSSSP